MRLQAEGDIRMTVATLAPAAVAPSYPANMVAGVLRDALVNATRSLFRRKGLGLPKADSDVVDLPQEVDSLMVVELLSKLDAVLPFKVTESVVKPGGYGSIATAVQHVVGRIKSKWDKHHAGGKA
jgi:hypothetical protein